jgi:RimJ/RimL family protein N-acetyltransferase
MEEGINLETKRLIMRPISENDCQQIFSYRSDAETMRFQSWIPNNIGDVREFIKNKVASIFNLADTWFQLVIVNKENGAIMGDIGVHFIGPENQQAELGCTLAKAQQRKGIATEALATVIDHLFSKFDKHRVFCSIDPENKPSISLVEGLGFRKEAHFKESIFMDGKWVDDLVFAVLKSEWGKE